MAFDIQEFIAGLDLTQADYNAYPDLTKHPKVAKAIEEAMKDQAEEILTEENERQETILQSTREELLGSLKFGTVQTRRSLSAGVLSILEKVKNPIFSADDSLEIDNRFWVEVLFCLCADTEDEIVDLAFEGREAFEKASVKFGMKINHDDLMNAIDQVSGIMESIMAETEGLFDGEEGETNPEKKTG